MVIISFECYCYKKERIYLFATWNQVKFIECIRILLVIMVFMELAASYLLAKMNQ